MKSILITGTAGFIGMHTAIKFLDEGYNVIGIDSINSYYSVDLKKDRLRNIKNFSHNKNSNWKFLKYDLNDPQLWKKLKEYKISKVIHLAAQPGVRYSLENPDAYLKSNILGFQKVIDFVVENKIKYFLYASSSSVYGKNSNQPFTESESCTKPESYYAATKRFNELMAFSYFKTHNLNSIGLRFFTVYGPWGRPDMAPFIFVENGLKNNKIKLFNNGNQTRDFTYVDDVVNVIFLISNIYNSKSQCEILNVGKGNPETLKKFILNIELAINKKLKISLYPEQPGDVQNTYCSNKKLKSFIKLWNFTDLNEGIKKFVNWYFDYYKIKRI